MDAQLQQALKDLERSVEAFKADYQAQIDGLERQINTPALGPGPEDGRNGDPRAAAAAFYAAVGGKPVQPEAVTEDQLEYLSSYREAFTAYLRRGTNSLTSSLQNAMSVGSDPAGGFWAPPAMADSIIRKSFDSSPVRAVASTITIQTEAIELPKDVNDLTGGGWVAELGSRTAGGEPDIGLQRIPVHEQYDYPELTQQLLDDVQAVDMIAWIEDKIADKQGRRESTAFVTGNGVAKPTGFVGGYSAAAVTTDDDTRSWGVLQYVASGASAGFPKVSGSTSDDPDALHTIVGKLKARYRANASWAMNRNTAATVRKLKDADGRYLWVDGLREGEPDRLLGYPVLLFEDMADIAADSFSIAFGDFRAGYLIVDRVGIRILRDPFTNKGKVGFYTTKRVGGDVRDFDAIKLMKFAAS